MSSQELNTHPISHNYVITATNNAITILKDALDRDNQLIYAPTIDRINEVDYEILHTFLIRVANQESGISDSGLSVSQGAEITHHKTNVMQLDDIAYEQIKTGTHFILRRLRAYLEHRNITIPPSIPTNTNQNVLMATFYIVWRINDNNNAIPSSCNEQAPWWKTHYNTYSGAGKIEDFKKNNCGVNEAISLSLPRQKLYEAKKLSEILYGPLHTAIVDSEFWTYNNMYDVDSTDINKILKNDVDQTEAAEVLTSALNNFFSKNNIPTQTAVHSPDPEINSKTIINPSHPNYPNRIIIGGNQGIAGDNNKKGSSKFLMNLHLGTYGDNFSISDIDPITLAKNAGALIRHELIHLYQIEDRRKNQRISRLDTLRKFRDEGDIPDSDNREDYLSSKIEIDAYAHEIAEEMLNKYGKDTALDMLRGNVKIDPNDISDQFKEYFIDNANSSFTRRLKRKIYGHIIELTERNLF
jgi:hypothetical protein